MQSIRLKLNFNSLIDFLIIFFLILDTHSIYNMTINKDYHILGIAIILLIFRMLMAVSGVIKTINLRTILVIISWLLYSLIYFFVNSRESLSFVNRFIILPVILIIYFNYLMGIKKFNTFLKYYVSIISCIAIISLFFWLFGSLLKIIPSSNWVDIQWGKIRSVTSYYGVYFQWQDDASFMGKVFFRNIGIFSEAPMYSLHLSLSFLIEYFIFKTKNVKKICLYIVTIISTYSVTGILLILMSLVLDYMLGSFSEMVRNRKLKFAVFFIPLVTLVAIFYGSKILDNKIESASGGSRLEDYRIGYLAWKSNPIFGTGFNKYDLLHSLKSITRYNRSATGFTNSPMIILVEGGVYFLLGFIQAFIHVFYKSILLKDRELFIFILMFLYLFLTTTFQHTAAIIVLISFALIDRADKKQILV